MFHNNAYPMALQQERIFDMLAILKLFVMILFVVLFFSALCGVVVFISDIKRFKLDTQMSLPRQKLIERYVDQQELEKGGDNNAV